MGNNGTSHYTNPSETSSLPMPINSTNDLNQGQMDSLRLELLHHSADGRLERQRGVDSARLPARLCNANGAPLP
jgi:hypothetical protein